VLAVFYLGRRFSGTMVGAAAALLLAVNAFHIRYSQEARGYALVTLLVSLSTMAFVQFREQPRRWTAVWYVSASVLAVYTHLFAVFVIAAHLFVACFDERVLRKRLLLAQAAIALLCAPLALFAKTKDVGQIAWIDPTSLYGIYDAGAKLSGHGPVLLTVLFAAAVLTGTGILITRLNRTSVLICGWAFLPVILALLVSLRKPIFLPRYLIVAQPALVLLAGIAFAGGRSWSGWNYVRVAAFALLIFFSGRSVVALYRAPFDPPPQHWRDLVQTIAAQTRPGDILVFYHPYMRMPFEYSRARAGLRVQAQTAFPPFAGAEMMIAPIQQMDAKRLLTPSRFHAANSVYLVRSSPPDATSNALQELLRGQFPEERTVNYGAGVDLFVYSRVASSTR
jgi:mannosyltransferase